jgi:hypothetical protein
VVVVSGKQEEEQLVGDVLVGQAFLGERIGGRDQCPHQGRIFGGISSTLLQDVVGKTVKCRACCAGAGERVSATRRGLGPAAQPDW